jgi:hypothetical protein
MLIYRIRQFSCSITAKPLNQAEKAYILAILTPSQATLFFALATYEQRHALNVCQTLCAGGHGTDKELLQAALLHDLGKFDPQSGRAIPVWGKVVNVLFSLLKAKALLRNLASPEPSSWRYVFWLQLNHEKRGARMALKAGSSKRVVALIGRCKTLQRRGDPAAIALKWADDLN